MESSVTRRSYRYSGLNNIIPGRLGALGTGTIESADSFRPEHCYFVWPLKRVWYQTLFDMLSLEQDRVSLTCTHKVTVRLAHILHKSIVRGMCGVHDVPEF